MVEKPNTVILRASARDAGLKWYFTGRPCKHGHLDIRQVANGVCRSCAKEIGKRYHAKNPGLASKWAMAYGKAHPEWVKEQQRKYYQRHKAKSRALRIKWVLENPEKNRGYKKAWKKRNPESNTDYKRNRRARERGSGERHTASDIVDLLVKQRHRCAICADKITEKTRQVDHIMPLAREGSNGRRNLQLLCKSCNSKKGPKDPIEFMQSLGRLL